MLGCAIIVPINLEHLIITLPTVSVLIKVADVLGIPLPEKYTPVVLYNFEFIQTLETVKYVFAVYTTFHVASTAPDMKMTSSYGILQPH